jgi:hypothetical protein
MHHNIIYCKHLEFDAMYSLVATEHYSLITDRPSNRANFTIDENPTAMKWSTLIMNYLCK